VSERKKERSHPILTKKKSIHGGGEEEAYLLPPDPREERGKGELPSAERRRSLTVERSATSFVKTP